MVIAPGPIDDYVPVCTQDSKGSGSDGDARVVVTQYDMNALEKAGMLKMDFLGLTTLTILTDALRAIRERRGETIDLDDERVLARLGGLDAILLDPPRDGAHSLVQALQSPFPARIVYVSCHPGSLARDAGLLAHEHGYRLSKAGIMNMFPHTAHVESIAVFERVS